MWNSVGLPTGPTGHSEWFMSSMISFILASPLAAPALAAA